METYVMTLLSVYPSVSVHPCVYIFHNFQPINACLTPTIFVVIILVTIEKIGGPVQQILQSASQYVRGLTSKTIWVHMQRRGSERKLILHFKILFNI
jgi:hypothetical protein